MRIKTQNTKTHLGTTQTVEHEPLFFCQHLRGTLKNPEQPKPIETLEQQGKTRPTGTGVIT